MVEEITDERFELLKEYAHKPVEMFGDRVEINKSDLRALIVRLEAAEEALEKTKTKLGSALHNARVASIGHDQLNRFIKLFDSAGFRGHHVDVQAKMAIDELKSLRAKERTVRGEQ